MGSCVICLHATIENDYQHGLFDRHGFWSESQHHKHHQLVDSSGFIGCFNLLDQSLEVSVEAQHADAYQWTGVARISRPLMLGTRLLPLRKVQILKYKLCLGEILTLTVRFACGKHPSKHIRLKQKVARHTRLLLAKASSLRCSWDFNDCSLWTC